MPSRPASICPSTFFKSDRLLQFSFDLSDIWCECAQRYCPKHFDFLLMIFNESLITKKYVTNGIFLMFLAIFSSSFQYGAMKFGLQACCGYFQVCEKNGPCGTNFRAVFGPK